MNNKYDVGNFSKLLEEFSVEGEIEGIEKHLYGEKEAAPKPIAGDKIISTPEKTNRKGGVIPVVQKRPKFEFVPYENPALQNP